MLRNNILLTLLVLFATISCSRGSVDFTLNDFPVGEICAVDLKDDFSSAIMKPSKIMTIGKDSLLLIEPMKDRQLLFLDISSGESFELLNRGNGPDEALYAWDIFMKGSRCVVYDGPGNKLLFYSTLLNGDEADSVVRMAGPVMNYPKIAGAADGFVALSSFSSGNRLTILDDRMNEIAEVPFPEAYYRISQKPDNESFQSQLSVTDAGDRIITACMDAPFLDVYSATGDLVRHLAGPFASHGAETDEKIYTFSCLSAFRGVFMVGYDGHGNIDGRSHISELLLFDSDGHPIKRYTLPENLQMFDVDWNTNMVYGISSDGEPGIRAFCFVP